MVMAVLVAMVSGGGGLDAARLVRDAGGSGRLVGYPALETIGVEGHHKVKLVSICLPLHPRVCGWGERER